MRARLFLAFSLLLAPLLVPGAAAAQAQQVQPLDRLLPQIRRAHPGQFFDAEGPTPGPDGQPHYHLKWMTPDGRILWLDADARNGRVMRQSPGRDMFDAPRGEAPRSDFRDQEMQRRDDARASGRPGPPDARDYGGYGGARPFGGNYPRGYERREGNPGFGNRDGGPRGFGDRGGNGPGQFGNRDFGGGHGRDRRR